MKKLVLLVAICLLAGIIPTSMADEVLEFEEVELFDEMPGEAEGLSVAETLVDQSYDEEEATEVSGQEMAELTEEAAFNAPTGAAAQNGSVAINSTNFPDASFRRMVENDFDENGDGKLSEAEIATAEDISLMEYEDCASVKGIEFFYNLTELLCWGAPLKTLDVSKNTKLTSLECEGCGLTSLNISGNPKLVCLIASGNKLTSIDIGNCPKLISTVNQYKRQVDGTEVYWVDDDDGMILSMDSGTRLTAGSKVLYNPSSSAVKLAATSVKLGVKETFALSPSVTPASKAKSVRFKSSKAKIASVNSKTGKITAKKKGTATISATLDGKVMATCTVTVVKAPGKVTLNKKTATVTAGNTLQLKAKIPGGTFTSRFTWKSSKSSVATVDQNGMVTAIKKGTAKITVKTGNGKTATCKVTVKAESAKRKELKNYMDTDGERTASALGLRYVRDCYRDDHDTLWVYDDFGDGVNLIGIFSNNKSHCIEGVYPGMTWSAVEKALKAKGYKVQKTQKDGYREYRFTKGKYVVSCISEMGKDKVSAVYIEN